MPTRIDDAAPDPHIGELVAPEPTFVASPWPGHGYALAFDGSPDQAVDLGNKLTGVPVPEGYGAAAAFTLEAKLTGSTGALGVIAGRWQDGAPANGRNIILYTNTNRIRGAIITEGNVQVDVNANLAGDLNPATKYHAAMVYDGVFLRLFVDGVLQDTQAAGSIKTTNDTARFMLGNFDNPADLPFTGTVDEVRLSDVARYTADFAVPSAPFVADANTLGLWHFDGAVVDSTTTLRLYERLPELYRAADQAAGYPLLRYLALTVDQASEVEELLDRWNVTLPDEGGELGEVSELVDPALADADWLPWLAQHVGVELPPAMPEQERRDNIAGASSGWRAGTRAALEAAAAETLTGTRSVDVIPNYGGSPWAVAVRTIPTETPDAAATLAAILAAKAKPAGVNLSVVSYSAPWSLVESTYPSWTSLEAAGSWDVIESTV